MSKAKYAIRNGDNVTGIFWENEKLGNVFVLQSDIDPNFDLEIYDCETHEFIKNVDMRDFLLEILPHKQD